LKIKKIISGGQTGADRVALDVAIKMGVEHGGWVSKSRKTEDGVLPDKNGRLHAPLLTICSQYETEGSCTKSSHLAALINTQYVEIDP
jgi:hypothetical protein